MISPPVAGSNPTEPAFYSTVMLYWLEARVAPSSQFLLRGTGSRADGENLPTRVSAAAMREGELSPQVQSMDSAPVSTPAS